MLKTFRDNLKHLAWALWLVIIAFVLIEFSIFGRGSGATPSTQAAATVGSEEISFREFQRAYSALENQYRSQLGENFTPELARQLGLHRQAIDGLIRDRLLLAEADRLGLRVNEKEIREQILEYPVFQNENGGFVGAEEYRRILTANNLSPADFERQVEEDLRIQKLNQVLSNSIWVSDEEVEKAAREDAERARIRFARLPGAAVAGEVEVADSEVESWFEENTEDYRFPERRRIGYVDVNINQVRAGLEIPEADLRAYYEANLDEFQSEERLRARHILLFYEDDAGGEQARARLEAIRARVEGGEDFAAIAREVSEDTATREQGGDLGSFARGEMAPAFEQAAFGAEAGSLVGPVEADFGIRKGVHLIQVLDKQPGGAQPFEEVSNRIRVRLLNERARQEAEEKAREIAAEVETRDDVDADTGREIAQQFDVGFEVLDPVTVDENVPGIGRGTPLVQAAFTLEPGTLGEPQRIPTGWAIPVVLGVQEPRLPELDEVRDLVRADVATARQGEVAMARLEQARAALDEGRSLDEVAADLGVTVQESEAFAAGAQIAGLGSAPAVVNSALALETGDFGGPVALADGGVVFEVTERQHFDAATFEEQREETRQRLTGQRLNQMIASMLDQRREELEVSYSREFIENFEGEPQAGG